MMHVCVHVRACVHPCVAHNVIHADNLILTTDCTIIIEGIRGDKSQCIQSCIYMLHTWVKRHRITIYESQDMKPEQKTLRISYST